MPAIRLPFRNRFPLSAIFATIVTLVPLAAPAALVISEFRVRGPNGANDEYVVISNTSATPHTVAAVSGTGYALAASGGVTRFTIPNGTIIPGYGSFLGVNSVGYSLASYPAGNGTTATGDSTYTTDIPDNAGIALFNNNTGGASFSLGNRLDAVGSTSEANTLYKEGTGYPSLTPFSIDYAFTRDRCGKGGSITTFGDCPNTGVFKDTNNNAADFIFVDTNGTSAGAGQRLGSPGPRNFSSPVPGGGNLSSLPLDGCVHEYASPNLARSFTSDPANNSTFGTIEFRRTFTNNTGVNLTRLRFRVTDQTTFPAPSGIADLRLRTSTAIVVSINGPVCDGVNSNVTVQGTTLEQPPSQPNGAAFNGSASAGTVTLGTPLSPGQSIHLRFLFGVQQNGDYKIALQPEALPVGAALNQTVYYEQCSAGCPAFPTATDFDGDLHSDVLYRNYSTGQLYRMTMDGYAATSANVFLAESDLNWVVVGDADFSGGGISDLLWRNTATGQVYVMKLSAGGTPSGAVVYTEPNPAWRIVHTPDLNGDGMADILWWNSSTGQVFAMLMNGTTVVGQGIVYTEPNTNWKIVAVGNFSGSGPRNQLVWHNSSTGQVYVMNVNYSGGSFTQFGAMIYAESNTNWKLIGVPDLNGDGKSDLLWRNGATGQVFGMLMNGSSPLSSGTIHTEPNLDWKIVAFGDYNGDRRADLLWRNQATGQLYMMQMNGLSIGSGQIVMTEPNTAWRALGPWEYGLISGMMP